MKNLLFTEAKLGPVLLRNRSIRSAAFEGMCPGNSVSDDLINYHASVAAGESDGKLYEEPMDEIRNTIFWEPADEARSI